MIKQNILTYGNLAEDAYDAYSIGEEISNGFTVTSTASNAFTGFKALSAYNEVTNTLAIGFAGTDTASIGEAVLELFADASLVGLHAEITARGGLKVTVGNTTTAQDAQALAFTKGAITERKMLACPSSEFFGPEAH